MRGVMLIGTLSVFMNYAQGMMEPIQWLVQVFSNLVNVQVNIERVTALMNTQSDVRDTPEVTAKYGDAFEPRKENWEPLRGDISFRDVTFRYPDGEENVLEHFNLEVPQGTRVAIVGETGAGKSTLVNLVCRFYEPTSGQVLIDGRDARERSQLWLHANIGYVLQTPHLFSGTVLENLRYGNPDATMQEIRGGGQGRVRRRDHRALAGRVRYAGGRGRQQPVYGRKAAAVVCAGASGRSEDFCARRGHVLGRYDHSKSSSRRLKPSCGEERLSLLRIGSLPSGGRT